MFFLSLFFFLFLFPSSPDYLSPSPSMARLRLLLAVVVLALPSSPLGRTASAHVQSICHVVHVCENKGVQKNLPKHDGPRDGHVLKSHGRSVVYALRTVRGGSSDASMSGAECTACGEGVRMFFCASCSQLLLHAPAFTDASLLTRSVSILQAAKRTVNKAGANKGRFFFCCARQSLPACRSFFKWSDTTLSPFPCAAPRKHQ